MNAISWRLEQIQTRARMQAAHSRFIFFCVITTWLLSAGLTLITALSRRAPLEYAGLWLWVNLGLFKTVVWGGLHYTASETAAWLNATVYAGTPLEWLMWAGLMGCFPVLIGTLIGWWYLHQPAPEMQHIRGAELLTAMQLSERLSTRPTGLTIAGIPLPQELHRTHMLVCGSTGCHAKGTTILMATGEVKAVEDITVGEYVMGPDSTPRKVTALHRGEDDMVRIVPIKGESFTVNMGHILSLMRTQDRSLGVGTVINMSVKEWIQIGTYHKHIYKLYRTGVDFSAIATLPIDPYLLGILLGDGCLRRGTPEIANPDDEILCEVIRIVERDGYEVSVSPAGDRCQSYRLVRKTGRAWYPGRPENPYVTVLKDLGLWGKLSKEKYLPQQYKVASRGDRLRLLAGLLDTDGSLGRGCYDYISASRVLADDITFLARSLGFAAYLTPCQKKWQNGEGEYFRVSISGETAEIPCQVKRKQAPSRQQKKNVLRTGFTIEPIGRGEYYGFTCDGDHLYVMGDFTVTHNSGKTVTIRSLLQQLLLGSDPCIVVDPEGEFTSEFYTPARGDVILNPLDARFPGWDPWIECETEADMEAQGASLFPLTPALGDTTAFYHRCARVIYRALLDQSPKQDPHQIPLLLSDPEELLSVLAGTDAAALLGEKAGNTRQGMLSTMQIACACFRYLPTAAEPWSTRTWAQDRRGWVFLTFREEDKEIALPLVSLWLDLLARRLLSGPLNPKETTWVVIDELAVLKPQLNLQQLLNRGRKRGVGVILGFQDVLQLNAIYGKEITANMLDQPTTRLLLRTMNGATQMWCAETLGQEEVERIQESETVGPENVRDSIHRAAPRKAEPVVMPSQFGVLPDLSGYLKVGHYGAAPVTFPYVGGVVNQPAFLARLATVDWLRKPTGPIVINPARRRL